MRNAWLSMEEGRQKEEFNDYFQKMKESGESEDIE